MSRRMMGACVMAAIAMIGCPSSERCAPGERYNEQYGICAGDCTNPDDVQCWGRDGGFVPRRDGASEASAGDAAVSDGDASMEGGVVIDPGIRAPRPVFPCSLCDTTSRRPTFRWALPAGVEGAVLELCEDRPCTRVIERVRADGTQATPSTELPARQVVFWRLRGRSGTREGSETSPTWLLHTPARSAPIATAGLPHVDVNGDGLDDVVVGLATADVGGSSSVGVVKIFHGRRGGPALTANTTLEGTVAGGEFGNAVDVADIDGDGFGDLAVGAWKADRVYVFRGGPVGIDPESRETIAESEATAVFGSSVVTSDFDGDGFADLAVPGTSSAGAVPTKLWTYRYASSSRRWSMTNSVEVGYSPGTNAPFQAVDLGDLDGDERIEVACEGDGSNIIVFWGDATTLVGRSTPLSISSEFSYPSIEALGDQDGDGLFDMLFLGEAAWVMHGRSDRMLRRTMPITVPNHWRRISRNAASGRDFNGDGINDLTLLGGPDFFPEEAAIYLGGRALDAPFQTIRDESWIGYIVALGDLDGDRVGDLVVGGTRLRIFPGSSARFTTQPIFRASHGATVIAR